MNTDKLTQAYAAFQNKDFSKPIIFLKTLKQAKS